MEQRLIDANALAIDLERMGKLALNLGCIIDEQPTVDAAPVVHARWKREAQGATEYLAFCSECGINVKVETSHCPNCGAKMDA